MTGALIVDVASEHEISQLLSGGGGVDSVLKGLTLDNILALGADDGDHESARTSPASSEIFDMVEYDSETSDLSRSFGDHEPDFFTQEGFLSGLDELPSSNAVTSLDSILPFMDSRDAGDLVLPDTSSSKSKGVKAKRKYTKRKSEDGGAKRPGSPKKRALTKHASTPASFLSNSSSPKGKSKALAKHESSPGASTKPAPLFIADSATTKDSTTTTTTTKSSKKKKETSSPSGATAAANLANIKQTSGFRGVSCCGKDRKWQARIRDANRVRYLGRFGTEVEAAFVYDEAARLLKGDRAPTNFVPLDEVQKETLLTAFVNNNHRIPEEYMHLVVRVKAKSSSDSSSPRSAPAPRHLSDAGVDSPASKLRTSNVPISPSGSVRATHFVQPHFNKPTSKMVDPILPGTALFQRPLTSLNEAVDL